MASPYLQSLLDQMAEGKITGRPTLNASQVGGAVEGDLAAQYQSGAQRRSLDIAQQQADTAAAAEKSNAAMTAANIGALKKEEQMAPYQTAISAVGAAGQLGLVYAVAKQAGLFGTTPPVGATGADYALAGSAAATGGVAATGAGIGGLGAGEIASAWALPAAEVVGAGYAGGKIGEAVGGKTGGWVGAIGAGAAVGAEIGSTYGPVGTVIGAIAGGAVGGVEHAVGCIVLSYMYGPESKQARTAKVFCAKHMDVPGLVGYYQVGKVLIAWCEKSPAFKRQLEKRLGRPFYRYMRWKLGKEKSILSWDMVVSRSFLSLCRLRYRMGRLRYFPQGSHVCMAQAMSHKEVRDA
jgi:hypothetical protein